MSSSFASIQILFEDDDLLVVYKPVGVLVYPFKENQVERTLVDALKELDISCHYEPSQHFNDIPEDESSQLTIRFREALAAPSDASDLWHTIEREASL